MSFYANFLLVWERWILKSNTSHNHRSASFIMKRTIFYRFPAQVKRPFTAWGLRSEISAEWKKLPLVLVGSGSLLNNADHVCRRHRRHSRCRSTHRWSPITHPTAPPLWTPSKEFTVRCRRNSPSRRNSLFDTTHKPEFSSLYFAISARVFTRPG